MGSPIMHSAVPFAARALIHSYPSNGSEHKNQTIVNLPSTFCVANQSHWI